MKRGGAFTLVLALVLLSLTWALALGMAVYTDGAQNAGNTFQAWASIQWTQTTQADFEAGVLNNADTSSSSGDVKLAASSNTVTDTFSDETKIASKTNLVIAGGQVRLTSSSGGSQSVTLQPSAADSWVEQKDPDKNYYNDTLMYVDSKTNNENRRSFVRFDLSSIPNGSTVSSANLSLFVKDCASVSRTLEVQRLSATWTESTITWNNQPSVSGSAVTTSTGTTKEVWLTWNVTSDVLEFIQNQTATNYGWRIKDQTEGSSTQYTESSYTRDEASYTTLRPKLSITYTPPPAYSSPGTLTSTNLLSGATVGSIDSFDYSASAIASGTSLKAQFSQDNANWHNSSGSLGGWDTLSQGTHSLGLSALGWSGANFYYKMEFTSDGNATPVLDEISINYSTYFSSGTVASQILDTGKSGARWYELQWDETLAASTDITFEVRASDTPFLKDAAAPSWTSVGGTSPVSTGLPSGQYMQWRATLRTSDSSKTPTLHEVRVYYY